jgi:hypothetical protein
VADGEHQRRLDPAGARYYRQYVCRVANFGLADINGMPWDDFLMEVETAMRLREDFRQ